MKSNQDYDVLGQISCIIQVFIPYPNDQKMENYLRDLKLRYEVYYELAQANLLRLEMGTDYISLLNVQH